MVINNQQNLIDASEYAAESQGFAVKWSVRMVRRWVASWIKTRELPKSEQDRHTKVFLLLDDPEVATELQSYLQTNKWSIDLKKLSAFTKNKLLPDEAKKYLHHVIEKEMPAGLKKYLEVELFPHVQMKVGKGISLQMARRWLLLCSIQPPAINPISAICPLKTLSNSIPFCHLNHSPSSNSTAVYAIALPVPLFISMESCLLSM